MRTAAFWTLTLSLCIHELDKIISSNLTDVSFWSAQDFGFILLLLEVSGIIGLCYQWKIFTSDQD